MPRNIKCRKVCCEPENKIFTPEDKAAEFITLSVEELESIRLCDLEGLEQDLCAERMGVSRGTFQRILYGARKNVAEALCVGKGILIEGGNYEVSAKHVRCNMGCRHCRYQSNK